MDGSESVSVRLGHDDIYHAGSYRFVEQRKCCVCKSSALWKTVRARATKPWIKWQALASHIFHLWFFALRKTCVTITNHVIIIIIPGVTSTVRYFVVCIVHLCIATSVLYCYQTNRLASENKRNLAARSISWIGVPHHVGGHKTCWALKVFWRTLTRFAPTSSGLSWAVIIGLMQGSSPETSTQIQCLALSWMWA